MALFAGNGKTYKRAGALTYCLDFGTVTGDMVMMKKVIPLMIALALLLSACKQPAAGEDGDAFHSQPQESSGILPGPAETAPAGSPSPDNTVTVPADEDMFTDRDSSTGYDTDGSVRITLNGDSAVSSSSAVRISGSTVILSEEGTYILSGTLNDGMVVVDAGKNAKLQLVLDGVSIHSETSAALYIRKAGKVFLTLAEGSENTLSNGGSFSAIDENSIDGALFSKDDLTLNGSGSLTVTSPGGHGIVVKDDLVFTGGSYTVNAASHGLDVNDSVRFTDAALAVTAGTDGIHVENNDDASLGFAYISGGTLDIQAAGDGISAGADLRIEGGDFHIVTGGGSANAGKNTSGPAGGHWGRNPSSTASADDGTSSKGLKASGNLLINGGTFAIDAADDAVHSNSDMTVNGGSFEIATGDDGFHADNSLTVTDGNILITKSYEGLEALHLKISGGDITLTATDDGLNAAGGTDGSGFGGSRGSDRFGGRGGRGGGSSNGTLEISGGKLYIKASGDGIDANGTLAITGGYIVVCGPIQGDTATLDYDVSGTISGGTFIGTGAYGMAQTFSGSEQGVIAVRTGNQAAGTLITLSDASGNTILSHTPELPFAVVILSSPEMVKGETYTLTVGAVSDNFAAS